MFSSSKFVGWALSAIMAFSFGLLAPQPANAQSTITFGAAVSITGKYSTNGKNTQDGYELAVERVNSKGGIKIGEKSYKIEVKYYDDESTPARGAQLVERLVNQDKVQFMLGPYSSGLTTAIAPVTEKYRVPMVEGNGAARDLFTKGYKYLFAVLSTSDQYLSSAIDLAAEQAVKDGRKATDVRVAMAFENDPFSMDVRDGILSDTARHGMKVVIDDKLPPELNDMSATLNKVRALKPDVLVVSAHAKGPPLVVRQMKQMQVYVPMIAVTHCDSAKVEKLGAIAENLLCASQWDKDLSYSDKWFGSAGDYARDFKAKYNYDAPYQAAESSASVLAFVDAITRAKSLDRNKVRDALAETDMETFYGRIKFDSTGKNTAKPMVLYQIQGGMYKVVAPTKWASAKFIHPIPR